MSIRFFRNILAAVALGIPSFEEKQVGRHDDLKPEEQIRPSKLATSGTVEQVNKHYGVTIAGGPGSQKIGDTFDALPQSMKDQFILARKGKAPFPTREEIAAAIGRKVKEDVEFTLVEGSDTPVAMSKMGRGIDAAVNRVYGDTPEKRLEGIKKVDAELASQRAMSQTGRLEDYEPPKKEDASGKETKTDS